MRSSMNAVVMGFETASGRPSGSVRYAYARQANAAAPTPATTFSASLITGRHFEVDARGQLERRRPGPHRYIGRSWRQITWGPKLPTDDDLEAFARRRLVVDGMAVHDGERRRLDEALALLFGHALPRVTRTGPIEVDPGPLHAL